MLCLGSVETPKSGHGWVSWAVVPSPRLFLGAGFSVSCRSQKVSVADLPSHGDIQPRWSLDSVAHSTGDTTPGFRRNGRKTTPPFAARGAVYPPCIQPRVMIFSDMSEESDLE